MRPGIARIVDMWAAGLRALRTRWRLALALYAVQFGVTLVFLVAVARTFSSLFGASPLFARGVAGDPLALLGALGAEPGAVPALVAAGVALAAGYAVLSWYLAAGTLGALAGDSFSEAAGARFFAYARVWLWSIIPYALSLIVTGVGLAVAFAASPPIGALTWFDFAGRPILGALPGVLLAAITACVTGYAQAILATERSRAATRATFRAWRLVFTAPWPLLHYLVYIVLWALISALYAQSTTGTAFAGAGGAVGLFFLRQLVATLRFAARFATLAGQLDGVKDRCARSA